VFGSAGERDVEKRRIQGRIADRFCDAILLTDEDPRGEDSMVILREIASGIKDHRKDENLFLVPDRRRAIFDALSLARSEDTVLLLGKGHEASIIYANGPKPWNEIEVAEECLEELGYRSPAAE
jgi:UDP-N-acetylmuramoyl-L-alanyl-D-glutamate--2,6-diaminopimelate ligase